MHLVFDLWHNFKFQIFGLLGIEGSRGVQSILSCSLLGLATWLETSLKKSEIIHSCNARFSLESSDKMRQGD